MRRRPASRTPRGADSCARSTGVDAVDAWSVDRVPKCSASARLASSRLANWCVLRNRPISVCARSEARRLNSGPTRARDVDGSSTSGRANRTSVARPSTNTVLAQLPVSISSSVVSATVRSRASRKASSSRPGRLSPCSRGNAPRRGMRADPRAASDDRSRDRSRRTECHRPRRTRPSASRSSWRPPCGGCPPPPLRGSPPASCRNRFRTSARRCRVRPRIDTRARGCRTMRIESSFVRCCHGAAR